jgi:hypothetical protein
LTQAPSENKVAKADKRQGPLPNFSLLKLQSLIHYSDKYKIKFWAAQSSLGRRSRVDQLALGHINIKCMIAGSQTSPSKVPTVSVKKVELQPSITAVQHTGGVDFGICHNQFLRNSLRVELRVQPIADLLQTEMSLVSVPAKSRWL